MFVLDSSRVGSKYPMRMDMAFIPWLSCAVRSYQALLPRQSGTAEIHRRGAENAANFWINLCSGCLPQYSLKSRGARERATIRYKGGDHASMRFHRHRRRRGCWFVGEMCLRAGVYRGFKGG